MNGRPVIATNASFAPSNVRGEFARFARVPLFTSGRPYTYSG